MQIIPASTWLEKLDASREAKLGGIPSRNTVEAPDEMDYPRGYKKCAACGAQSVNRMKLDGTPYYCVSKKECQNERFKRFRRDNGLVA